MGLPVSKKEFDRLGDRLRDASVLDPEDLRLLEAIRPHYLAALERVRAVVNGELGLVLSAREKNRDTILEKLRRERDMRLSRIQDIVGVRVARDMTLDEQDALVAQVGAHFADHRIRDRRKEPSHGYRAVHLILKLDGIPVEVQVRTALQHGWAQAMERLGDKWGRQIRYGGEPADPGMSHHIIPGASPKDRHTWVKLLKNLSEFIAMTEQSKVRTVSLIQVDASQVMTIESLLDSFLTADL